ncbi:response regulator [Leptolyngbyaceae cyanobacterium UHCC 1019]
MSTRRVLVIDDEDAVREVVQGCFEEVAGWQVLSASSGQEGLEKALTEKPDAIVLDMMMPEMSGIMFLRALSDNPTIRAIPVVLLSARTDLIDPDAFPMMGVRGAIAKPFDPFVMVRQVAEFLRWAIEE